MKFEGGFAGERRTALPSASTKLMRTYVTMIEHSGCRWRIYGAWMVLVGKATAVQLLSEDDIRAEAAVESCFPAARLASDGCMSGQSGDLSAHYQRAGRKSI